MTTSQFKLTARDKAKLAGVHPDLLRVVERAASIGSVPFVVLEGTRSVKRQRELVAKGMSKTMNSRHLTGHAVDIAPLHNGKVSWSWAHYYPLAKLMKTAAKLEGVTVEWGGDWRRFKDGPHWQLPWKLYPKAKARGLIDTASDAFSEEVDEDIRYEGLTDRQAAARATGIAASGAGTGVVIGTEPLMNAIYSITDQQMELTSGDWVRITIAVTLIALTIWGAYTVAKGDADRSEPEDA